MKPSYLRLARQGKNDWWRYCLGIVLAVIFTSLIGVICAGLFFRLAFSLEIIPRGWQYELFVARRIVQVVNILGLYIVLNWLHKRPFSTLISINQKFSVRRLLVAFAVVIPLLFALVSISSFTFDGLNSAEQLWFPLIALSTIIQSAGEEFLYRGYIMQGLNLINPHPVFAIVLSSLAFAYSHYLFSFTIPSEEMGKFSAYFIWGVINAVLTIKTNRIESAIALHSGWNMMQILLRGISNS